MRRFAKEAKRLRLILRLHEALCTYVDVDVAAGGNIVIFMVAKGDGRKGPIAAMRPHGREASRTRTYVCDHNASQIPSTYLPYGHMGFPVTILMPCIYGY